MTLGESIKKRREELKLSQECVADRLGVSRQAVSKWETNQSEPTAGNLIQLADILEISLSELVAPHKTEEKRSAFEKDEKKPNLILRANLIKLAIIAPSGPLRKFCVSVFRQNQEYHIINVHDWGLFPLATAFPGGWDGMRALRGVNAVPTSRES